MPPNSNNIPLPMGNNMNPSRVLGITQEQRGSELQAGARAELIPSPVTYALSSITGRVLAKLFLRMGAPKTLQNYAALRPFAMMEAVRRALPPGKAYAKVLDPFAGYTPAYLWLAEEMPQTIFYEADLPSVLTDKQRRLKTANNVAIPPNLFFKPAQWKTDTLEKVLDNQKMDVIVFDSAYLSHDDLVQLLQVFAANLTPQGAIVSLVPWSPGIRELAQASRMFRMQVGDYAGSVETVAEIRTIYQQTVFHDVNVMMLTEMADHLDKPAPANVEVVVIARRSKF